MHGQLLVTGAVDEAKRSRRVELSNRFADRYLVAAHNSEVRGDERDHASEVEVLFVLYSEVHREIGVRFRGRTFKCDLELRVERACAGRVGPGDDQQ